MKAALILAAGFGSRLRPYTEYCPKPILPVAGIEPLFFALWRAKELGAEKFYVNAHYKSDEIQAFVTEVAEPKLGIEVEVLKENPVLGTGGAILNLLKQDSAKSVSSLVTTNGDTLLGFDLSVVDSQNKSNWCLVSEDRAFLNRYKPLWFDAARKYCGVGDIQAPKTLWMPAHFLGLHHLSKSSLEYLRTKLDEIHEIDLFRGIYKPLSSNGLDVEVLSVNLGADDFWFDMTNKDFFLEAQKRLLSSSSSENSCWIKAMTSRHGNAEQRGSSYLWGEDPGCIDWSASRGSFIINTNKKLQGAGFVCNGSVLFLGENSKLPTQSLKVNNSLVYINHKYSAQPSFSEEKIEDEILLI